MAGNYLKIGMMWVKDKPKITWEQSINDAYMYYVSKYGHKPDRCYLHPSVLEKDVGGILISTFAERGLSIESVPYIMKNCLWMGVEERENYRDN